MVSLDSAEEPIYRVCFYRVWLFRGSLPKGNVTLKGFSCLNMDAASLENYQGLPFKLKSSYFPPDFNGSKINISLYTLNLKMLYRYL